MKKLSIILVLIFTLCEMFAQKQFDYKEERVKFNQMMINKNHIGKIFIKKINDDEQFEGSYLGKITTDLGQVFYIVNSSYVFDIKKLGKTENHIFIHDSNKCCFGYYYLSFSEQLPIKLIDSCLFFKKDKNKKKLRINFKKDIPNFINLKFEFDRKNDIYEFSQCK